MTTIIQTTPVFDKPLERFPEDIPFAAMTRTQKCVYVAKLVICIGTFGFVFPHV